MVPCPPRRALRPGPFRPPALLLAGLLVACPATVCAAGLDLEAALDRAVALHGAPAAVPEALLEELAIRSDGKAASLRARLRAGGRAGRAERLREGLQGLDWTADPLRFKVGLGSNQEGAEEYWSPRSISVMVAVPAGGYRRGSALLRSTRPIRQLRVGAFLIDRDEVTVARYDAFLRATGYRRPRSWNWQQARPARPAVDVSWDDARAYADWVGQDLPREAEWERAALGDGRRFFPWGNQRPSRRQFPHVVAPRLPDAALSTLPLACGELVADRSPYGVRDMGWNVLEWCRGSPSPARKLVKGHGVLDDPQQVRHLWGRTFLAARKRFRHVGFRLVERLGAGRLPERFPAR